MTTSAAVRMYRMGELGDCFLLTFTSGAAQSRMLIDCGSFRNGAESISRIGQIAKDIAGALAGKPLDVVVGTHQHNDHLSGFVHCKRDFQEMHVGEVWLSWLDNPDDATATALGEKHSALKLALHHGSERLRALPLESRAKRAREVLDDILGFYGAAANGKPPELPAEAVRILKTLGRKRPQYLKPGRVLEMPGLPAGTVRVYVLGPPRDSKLLYRTDPRTGESYDPALAAATTNATRLLEALGNHTGATSAREEDYPFGDRYQRRGEKRSRVLRALQASYEEPQQKWRRIDDDWIQQAESLALYLDTFTNNSSLVLAIELVESGKVLLFAADAQTGNWVSWDKVAFERPGVTTSDLLARTVLYKVGHHASHNATLVQALEKMNSPELSALIPVDKKDPNITKENGWRMPARNLFKRLAEKTSHRVLQMDDVNPASCDWHSKPVMSAWKEVGIEPRVTPLFVEVEIR